MRSMSKKLMALFLCLTMICGLMQTAFALTYTINDRERSFAAAAEDRFPGWRATHITWYSTIVSYYKIILMGVQDGMLCIRRIDAETNDPDGERWLISEAAPIPLTDAGASRAAAALDAFVLAPVRYEYATQFLSENDLLSESAQFLLQDGETLAYLYPYADYLVGIARNSADQDSLRIASWDGTAYGDVLATSMQELIWINYIHSGNGSLEIYAATSEDWLVMDEDGIWHLEVHTPDDDARYVLEPEGIVESALVEYEPYYNNDAWHYGPPTFPTTLPELVFTEIPYLEDAIPLLDASGWACVKTEGAALYDVPDGDVLANCFCRLPGRVLEQAEGWTLLLIGSEELGLKGWFHTEELAFGAETEEVICSFPSFDHAPLEGMPFETEVCQQLHDDFFWGFEFWLIGKTPAGDWLMLIDERLVRTVSPELVGETRPILHWWEDWEMIGPWDDEGEE